MRRKCFVPGCTTDYTSTPMQEQILCLFKALSQEQLENWRKVIPRNYKMLTKKDVICELHFNEEDIERYEEMPGSNSKLKKEKASIREDAIPAIFLNLPMYSNNLCKILEQRRLIMQNNFANDEELEENSKGTKTNLNRNNISTENEKVKMKKKRHNVNTGNRKPATEKLAKNSKINKNGYHVGTEDDANFEVIEKSKTNSQIEKLNINRCNINAGGNNTNKNKVHERFTFDMLVSNLNSILKPDNSWGISEHETFIVCAKWNEYFLPEKKIVIGLDLKVEVYMKEEKVVNFKNLVLNSVEDVSSVLQEVDSMLC